MCEYEALNHLSAVDPTKRSLPSYSTSRLRSTTRNLLSLSRLHLTLLYSSDKSLSEALTIGPKLQPELFDILLIMRRYKYFIQRTLKKHTVL